MQKLSSCRGVVGDSFVACGESADYGYCSPECEATAKIQSIVLDDTVSFDFITSRLAVGNVASRAVGGFVAVVSLLATAPVDELHGAPKAPGAEGKLTLAWEPTKQEALGYSIESYTGTLHILHIDINDGESPSSPLGDGRDLADYLDDATAFIAAHLHRGCVLVHCGAGKSRSVAVVVAYLCRYAGMSYPEALSLVKSRRLGAAPADCFAAAIKRWLRLDDLETTGPRR